MIFDLLLLQDTAFGLPCWLLWALASLGALLLGMLLNWLFNRGKDTTIRELGKERDGFRAALNDKEKDYASLEYKYNELVKEKDDYRRKYQSCEADKSILQHKLDKAIAESGIEEGGGDDGTDQPQGTILTYGNIFKQDDNLQIIEGIGPKVEALLKSNGISNWKTLANTSVDQLKGILGDADLPMINPSSWPQQAELAFNGKWADLIALQKSLDPTGGDSAVSKLEQLAASATQYSDQPEDLQVVEGIGPKIEEILKANGINTRADLANADVDRLKAILADNGLSMHDPTTWPEQARLASSAQWDTLASYQSALDSGSETADSLYAGIFANDNLQIVEGIGPKIEGLLKNAGVNTWNDLAGKTEPELRAILEAAGSRYKMHDPKSWPDQAKLAATDEWEDLVDLQKRLDSGGTQTPDAVTDSKVEKLALKILGFSNNPEDLKIVEGIGPKIEGLLKDAGINTWAELGAAPIDTLKEILANAGDRYRLADPSTWAKQAGLAAEGKWKELSEYQDYLQGGKDPG